MAMTREQATAIHRLFEVGFDVLLQAPPSGPGFLEAALHAQAEAVGQVLGEPAPIANLSAKDRRVLMGVDESDAERLTGVPVASREDAAP